MKDILFFSEIDKSMNASVGGKGANLGEMTKAGLPVPPGFCLTTAVYDEFASELKLEVFSAAEARSELQKRELPAGCIAGMKDALKEFPEGTLFSVRSSATAEDLPYASFAGQQDTYLNVKAEDLEDAVKDCFVSLYTDRAVSYRKQNGIEKPSMSVVVQQMVRSDASGIMFTADPVSGNRNRLVIDAVFGLGEAIVSGLVSPDHIVFDKTEGKTADYDAAVKEFALIPLAEGGTERKTLNSGDRVLNDRQIRELASLGERLERHYGSPQDVEWAIENGKLYLLQTRAITSLYPVPGPFADGRFHFLFNLGYQQMNPKAMPVMALDCMAGATNLLKKDLTEYESKLIRPTGQHFFVDMSLVCGVKPLRKVLLKGLPIADPLAASAVRELLSRGHRLSHPLMKTAQVPPRALRAVSRFMKANDPARAAAEAVNELRNRSERAAAELRTEGATPEGMRTLFRDCLIIDGFVDIFFPMVISGVLALNGLKRYENKLGYSGRWTDALQSGNEGNIITEMGLALGDLADLAASDEDFRRSLKEHDDTAADELMQRNDEAGKTFRNFMELYGFRGTGEIDISQPRYAEDPSLIIYQILAMSEGKEPGLHRREFEEKNALAKKTGDELIAVIEKELGKSSAGRAKKLLAKYQAYYPLREHFKYYWMKTFYEARKLLLRTGRVMVRMGQIDSAEDIMHLHLVEVYDALGSGDDMRSLVAARRQEFDRVARLTPPRILTSEGEVLMGGISRDDIPDGALAGVAVSPGTVEGVAKVVLDPKGATVSEGEILVAPYTDPGWTPLFVNAAAVITEVGGMLTHGAVVAREYGIPGVVGVNDATKRIKNGQKIRVDGSSGYIEILG